MKKVIVTGATGFTGKYVVRELIGRNYEVTCLVRETSDVSELMKLPVGLHYGDLNNAGSMVEAFARKDYLVNVASIGFGHAPAIVEAAEKSGLEHCVFFSTTAIFTSLPAKTKSIRLKAEEVICNSSLKYTIIRPTMIYGSRQDRNMFRLLNYIRKYPVLPVFGSGKYLQQPVYVCDLAKAVADVLGKTNTIGKAYNLAGNQPLTYNEVIDTVSKAINRRVLKIHLPLRYSLLMVYLLTKFGLFKKISVEQILRLNEDKAFSYNDAARDFGYAPTGFSDGIKKECAELYNEHS